MLNKNNNSDGIISLSKQDRAHSPTIDSMMREVLHTLRNIDFQHDAELERLESPSRKSWVACQTADEEHDGSGVEEGPG